VVRNTQKKVRDEEKTLHLLSEGPKAKNSEFSPEQRGMVLVRRV